MRNLLKATFLLLLLNGCFPSDQEENKKVVYFFDLKTYFLNTAEKLNQSNPLILKSVSKNEETETKKLKIKNWKQELALFIDADINKPAWKDLYSKDSTSLKIIYTANNLDLKTQKIEIDMALGLPKKIKITTKVSNLLYQTNEDLVFYADSGYRIDKNQNVLFLGQNKYKIAGDFKF